MGIGEGSKLDIELSQMSTSNFLVELLGQHVHAKGEFLRSGPQGDLGKNLIGEGAGHDKRRVASSTPMEIRSTVSHYHQEMEKISDPKFTRRPEARRRIWRPEGMV